MQPFFLMNLPSYLVAFSGGADSRLLLELTLRKLLEEDGEAGRSRVIAAHLHHGIRGEEADRDLEFCRRVCEELRIELICDRVDVPALAAARGESLETAARKARYEFFTQIMNERKIHVLLTAHHADDNLETVLAQLMRGSGTRGMAGIPHCRTLDNGYDPLHKIVHRPLLGWTKREILKACADRGLDYVTDSTNNDESCTRNRIRHTLIPAMEAIAGEDVPQRAAARMSQAAKEDDAYLSDRAEQLVCTTLSPYRHAVELESLNAHHISIKKRTYMVLYEYAFRFYYPEAEHKLFLTDTHLSALLRLSDKGIPESSLSLPGGLEARIRDGFLYVAAASEAHAALPPDEAPLPDEGTIAWGKSFTVTVERSPIPLTPCKDDTCYASAVFPTNLPTPLILRKRQAGDTILSHGMTKKLKKLLCDKDIPPHLRDLLPMICLPDGQPLWYPRAAFRDGYPAPDEGPCVRITVRYIK